MAAIPAPLSHTVAAIDAAYVAAARNGDSLGVSMSQVIHPCDRALFYAFRWAAEPEPATGQRQRIFETGNVYERRLLDMLRMIGCDVFEIDETTGKQFRVELAGGHLRGKMDAVATGIPEAPETPHVVELKSANDKSFKAIVKGPIRETKPEHHAQIQLYMHAESLRRGLYLVVNKNTDEIHAERVEYDPALCLAIIARVERIVALDAPPARLHDDPTKKGAIECMFCPARAVCHEGAFARTNCRTCLEAQVSDGPRWICGMSSRTLRYEEQQAGCSAHRFIPALVPGDQIDADPATRRVTYQMRDGSVWIDGGEQGRAA